MNHLKTLILLALMTVLFMAVGYLIGGPRGMMLALVFAAGTNLMAWWNSDKMALKMHKAREVSPREAPDLHEMVARLAARAELPMPRVYLIDSPQPNAFATGRDPENAAVAVTTGILQLLDRDELQGVMAHELAHIKNRDTLTMTLAATMAGAISMISQYGLWFGGGGGRDRPLGGIGLLLAAILAPMGALLIRMVISRNREYAADRMGAMISGNPLALASALQKISAVAKRRVMRSAERNPASAHLFIINPLTGGKIDSMFSTHPNVENRVRELIELAKEMGQDVADALTGGGGRGPGGAQPQPIPVRTSSVPRTRRDTRRGPWR